MTGFNSVRRLLRRVKKYARAYRSMIFRERAEYTLCFPNLYYTYSPWQTHGFQSLFATVKENSLVTADRCHVLKQLVEQACHLDGHFAECGVFKGGTAWMIGKIMTSVSAADGKNLILFDTFEGMPDFADLVRDKHRPGDFANTSLEHVRSLLAPYGSRINIRPGVLPETFSGIEVHCFAFVHIDVDLYPSTKASFEFFYPRMVRGGIMLCDDYGFEGYQEAARSAVDEFFASRLEVPLVLPTGQCLVVKL